MRTELDRIRTKVAFSISSGKNSNEIAHEITALNEHDRSHLLMEIHWFLRSEREKLTNAQKRVNALEQLLAGISE